MAGLKEQTCEWVALVMASRYFAAEAVESLEGDVRKVSLGWARRWAQEITGFSDLDDWQLGPDEFRGRFYAAQAAFAERRYFPLLTSLLNNGEVEDAVVAGHLLVGYLEQLAEWLKEPPPSEVPNDVASEGSNELASEASSETTPIGDAVPEVSGETPTEQGDVINVMSAVRL